MCHHVHGTLSAEDRKNVKTFAGIMIPVYASIPCWQSSRWWRLAVGGSPRSGEIIAASSASSATR